MMQMPAMPESTTLPLRDIKLGGAQRRAQSVSDIWHINDPALCDRP